MPLAPLGGRARRSREPSRGWRKGAFLGGGANAPLRSRSGTGWRKWGDDTSNTKKALSSALARPGIRGKGADAGGSRELGGGGMVKSCWFRAGGGRKRWPVHSAAFGLFENQEGREGAAPRSGRPGSRPLRDLRESVLPRGSACDGRTSRPGPALTPAVSSAEHSSKLWSMAGTSGSSSDAIFPRPLPQR